MLSDHDERRLRCRRLGQEVTFRYCRTQEGATVCRSILDCWWEVFGVEAFLARQLPETEFAELLRPVATTQVAPAADSLNPGYGGFGLPQTADGLRMLLPPYWANWGSHWAWAASISSIIGWTCTSESTSGSLMRA